jgi:hypothetical protein
MFDIHSKEGEHRNEDDATAHSAHGADEPRNDGDQKKDVK